MGFVPYSFLSEKSTPSSAIPTSNIAFNPLAGNTFASKLFKPIYDEKSIPVLFFVLIL